MEFARHIQRQFVVSLLLTSLSWLVAVVFYQPRSLLSLAAPAVSAICGITVFPALRAAALQLTSEPSTRIGRNMLVMAAASVPVAVAAVAVLGLIVVLAVMAAGALGSL